MTMNKLLLAGACAASIMLGVSSVQAADFYEPVTQSQGWYVSIFGGASWLDELDVTYSNSGTAGLSETVTDAGFIVGGAIGMDINQNMRAEVEVSYFENSVNQLDYPYFPVSFSASGHVNSVNVLVNIWHDFDMGGGFTPYVGGGAGVGFVDARAFRPNPPDDFNELIGSDIGFAFQVGAGLKFELTDMIGADIGYRYRGIMDVSLPSDDPVQANASTDIYGHFVQAGITVNLNGM
jgi:opacity protein-like surface antigen